MPRIMGVLTHLDMLKNTKQLKHTKKTLKHRFWTEVYDGAKLFYLSGLLHGEYLRNEIRNLGRFISVMKFRPLAWRSSHSYILSKYIIEMVVNILHFCVFLLIVSYFDIKLQNISIKFLVYFYLILAEY